MTTAPQTLTSAHLVGVCGAGMKALAELLDGLGCRLSGTDLAPATAAIERLVERGLLFHQGHSAEFLPPDAECLVYSPAVGTENPERKEAARRGVPQWSYSQMVGRLMQSRAGVCIAGTHGKSTTTAMVGWVLTHAGCEPSVLFGAELGGRLNSRGDVRLTPSLSPQSRGAGAGMESSANGLAQTSRSGWAGTGELFVVESCEFERSFLDFSPRYAAILSVEPDHFDCFADMTSLMQAFAEFTRRVSQDGVLVVRGDCGAAMDCVLRAAARVVTFGVDSGCEWRAEKISPVPEGMRFEIVRREQSWGEITLPLPGEHNVLNAVAAAVLCAEIGLSADEIRAGLRSFPGIRRRFEFRGEWNGVTLISDYAHHPTAVRATLKTAREVFGTRRIWCVFQPHQVSRTLALMDEFATSFGDAGEVIIPPVFAARERLAVEPLLASRELVRRIAAQGVSCRFVESLDRIVATVEDAARPGDVLILMGAGDIERILARLNGV